MAKFQIWYMRNFGQAKADPANLAATHVHLKDFELPGTANQLERVYHDMQGEVWSPEGEARSLIEEKGLQHTSMSMGDIIVTEHKLVFQVAMVGFKVIGGIP